MDNSGGSVGGSALPLFWPELKMERERARLAAPKNADDEKTRIFFVQAVLNDEMQANEKQGIFIRLVRLDCGRYHDELSGTIAARK
jgi:hypothetical protein